jgi:type IV secretory pathway VirB10-like protein
MSDFLYDEDEEEKPSEPGQLTEEQEREKRYAEEAAQKLTRGGGLDEPLDRVNRTRVLAAAGVAVALVVGGVAWARAAAKSSDSVTEREVIRRDNKRAAVPEVFKNLGSAPETPQQGDAYDAIDPKDPAFTTPVTTLPPEQTDDSDPCPGNYTPAQCAKMEQARMAAEGDPDGRSKKYMGGNSSYAANTGGKRTGDYEDEGLAPLGYFGTTRHQTPVSVARQDAPEEMAPMVTMPGQGMALPPNLRQALEKAAEGQGPSDPDDAKEAFAARPGVLDSMDDERELAECELTAGTPIHVANISEVNTDVPGKSSGTAEVTQTVYCGSDKQYVAIPQGSTFTFSANPRVSYGDEQIQVCMEQLKRPPSRGYPRGSLISMHCWGGASSKGSMGWAGEVDNHWDKLVAGVMLSTVLSLGTGAAAGNQEGFAPTIAQRAAANAGQQFNQAGQRIVQRDLARKPTIIRQMQQAGTVIVTENKPMKPWKARLARRRTW